MAKIIRSLFAGSKIFTVTMVGPGIMLMMAKLFTSYQTAYQAAV